MNKVKGYVIDTMAVNDRKNDAINNQNKKLKFIEKTINNVVIDESESLRGSKKKLEVKKKE